jgi:hypothetical protein
MPSICLSRASQPDVGITRHWRSVVLFTRYLCSSCRMDLFALSMSLAAFGVSAALALLAKSALVFVLLVPPAHELAAAATGRGALCQDWFISGNETTFSLPSPPLAPSSVSTGLVLNATDVPAPCSGRDFRWGISSTCQGMSRLPRHLSYSCFNETSAPSPLGGVPAFRTMNAPAFHSVRVAFFSHDGSIHPHQKHMAHDSIADSLELGVLIALALLK